jgi:hypothetical protein
MYQDKYYNDYDYSQSYQTKKKDKDIFLFLVVQGMVFNVRALCISGHTLQSVIPVFNNMFPGESPVGVFKVTLLEAYLLANNFRTHNLTFQQFKDYLQHQQQQGISPLVQFANGNGYANVYIETNEGQYKVSLNNTGNFFGFIVNQQYLTILNLMFYASRSRSIETAAAGAYYPAGVAPGFHFPGDSGRPSTIY